MCTFYLTPSHLFVYRNVLPGGGNVWRINRVYLMLKCVEMMDLDQTVTVICLAIWCTSRSSMQLNLCSRVAGGQADLVYATEESRWVIPNGPNRINTLLLELRDSFILKATLVSLDLIWIRLSVVEPQLNEGLNVFPWRFILYTFHMQKWRKTITELAFTTSVSTTFLWFQNIRVIYIELVLNDKACLLFV